MRANQVFIRYEGGLFYETPRETSFGITSSIQGYNYEDELIPGEDIYYSRILNRTEADIRGEFYYRLRQTPRSGNQEHFYGVIGNASLEARIRRFNFRAQFSKDIQFSFWTDSIFFVEYRYGGGLSFYLTRFIRLDYDYSNGDNRYPGDVLVRFPDESYEIIQRSDNYKSHRLGVVFRIIRNTGLGLTLNSWERSSNDYRYGKRKSLFIGGYITYDF